MPPHTDVNIQLTLSKETFHLTREDDLHVYMKIKQNRPLNKSRPDEKIISQYN